MDLKMRILTLRLLQRMQEAPEAAQRLQLEDTSHYRTESNGQQRPAAQPTK